MNDEELTRRLAETLRAKAEQVPDATDTFDPSAPLTELDPGSTKSGRNGWRYALVAAAAIALLVGLTAVLVGAFSDDRSGTAGPSSSTTIETSTTVAPSTTTAPTTTTVPEPTTSTAP